MTTPQLTGTHRTVLRALADAVVPSLDRSHDPTGFWALGGRELQADAAVAQALLELPDEQREGLLVLLEGLHALGFTTVAVRTRAADSRRGGDGCPDGRSDERARVAHAGGRLRRARPRTGSNPMWAGFNYPGPPGSSLAATSRQSRSAPTEPRPYSRPTSASSVQVPAAA